MTKKNPSQIVQLQQYQLKINQMKTHKYVKSIGTQFFFLVIARYSSVITDGRDILYCAKQKNSKKFYEIYGTTKKNSVFFLTKFTVDGYFFFMDSLAVSELDMKILSRLYVLRCVSVFYVCLYMRNVNAVTNVSVFLGLCAGRRGGCKTFYFKQTVKY